MSEDIPLQEIRDVSQKSANLSNFDYGDYINNVKASDVPKEPTTDSVNFAQPNAEDEITAILLSAMMGSIVKGWEIKLPMDKDSKCSKSYVSKKSSGGVATQQPAADEKVVRQPASKVTLVSHRSSKEPTISTIETRTKGSNKSTTFEGETLPSFSILNQPSVVTAEPDSRSVDAYRNTLLSQRTVNIEESPLSRLEKVKDLLIYNRENVYGWEFLKSGEEFIIIFNRGNRYEGKLLNCRMHGEGTFYWADGSVYKGNFLHGKMTGQGKLYWPDGSWYEGEFHGGLRHGRGLYVKSPTFYAGYWRNGCRHGVGAMFYNHFDTKQDYYNGEWFEDLKHNTGLRSYPSGAQYSGMWASGKRHGLGTMVWTNGDVYSGDFRKGKMHGYGEYTWETFYNQQLVVPQENCYYGQWAKNTRHGNGTLETTCGVIVRGTWENGKKHGPGEVICSNGIFLYAENLFGNDSLCLSFDSSAETDSPTNEGMQSIYKLPVTAASHEINVRYYVDRLVQYINENYSFEKLFCSKFTDNFVELDMTRPFIMNRGLDPVECNIKFNEEETHLRNVLMQLLSTLKVIYNTYAQVCCKVKPNFPTILMRIMWWQLLRDCNLHEKGFSLAHFDICIANNKACLVQEIHYPFERLLFWQFLHCLIEVSWELYSKKCTGTPTVKGIIASGFHKLVTTDLIPNAGHHKGNALFKCRDLMSLESLYWFYRNVGEPHSAREFLKHALVPQEHDFGQESVIYAEHHVRGKNIIGVGGKLTYFPQEEPLLTDSKYQSDPNHPKNLSCFSSLGLLNILKCIIEVCKSVSTNGLLVNMDYKIVFLEFYEIVLLCAIRKAKRNILERKRKEGENMSKVTLPEENITKEPSLSAKEVLTSPEKSGDRKKSSISQKTKKKSKK